MNTATTLAVLAEEMTAARERTGDGALAHSVKSGLFRLTRVTYDRHGRGNVQYLSEPAALQDHLTLLRSLGR